MENWDAASYELEKPAATVIPLANSTSSEIAADYWTLESCSIEIGFSLDSVAERRSVYTIVVVFNDGKGDLFSTLPYSLLM